MEFRFHLLCLWPDDDCTTILVEFIINFQGGIRVSIIWKCDGAPVAVDREKERWGSDWMCAAATCIVDRPIFIKRRPLAVAQTARRRRRQRDPFTGIGRIRIRLVLLLTISIVIVFATWILLKVSAAAAMSLSWFGVDSMTKKEAELWAREMAKSPRPIDQNEPAWLDGMGSVINLISV